MLQYGSDACMHVAFLLILLICSRTRNRRRRSRPILSALKRRRKCTWKWTDGEGTGSGLSVAATLSLSSSDHILFFQPHTPSFLLHLPPPVVSTRDLAVDLRMKLGDWFRVVQLLKTGGGAGTGTPIDCAHDTDLPSAATCDQYVYAAK